MRINDAKAQREVAKYLNRLLDEKFGGECSFEEAKSTADEVCEHFGMPGAILVSDQIDGQAVFRLSDPLSAVWLAGKILMENRKAMTR